MITKIIPKARFFLPLFFKNKKYFSNKIITSISFLFTGFIYWNVYNNIQKIGNIENIIT